MASDEPVAEPLVGSPAFFVRRTTAVKTVGSSASRKAEMVNRIEENLRAAGITLPEAAAPAANYLSYTMTGNLLQISGQLPLKDGKMPVLGKVGAAVSLEDAQESAKLCAINVLAQAKAALNGDWDRFVRLVKLTVFVASDPSFTNPQLVANGGSNLLVDILGEDGRHSRSAVGVAVLPLDAPVEIEALFEVK